MFRKLIEKLLNESSLDYKSLKVGDRLRYRGREGVLMSKPEYISFGTHAGWYAMIKWEDEDEPRQCPIHMVGMEKVGKK